MVMAKRNIAFGFIASCFAALLVICLLSPKHEIENAPNKLSIIGPYGDDEAYHPKVLYFENGWNGYTYWLSYTPYPHADDTKEDPCIACSNDLETWVVPPGLINPLSRRDNDRGYNSDTQSSDEISWDIPSQPILSPGDNARDWDAMGLYRATFLKGSDGYDILYSAYGLDGTRGIGLIRDVNNLYTMSQNRLSHFGVTIACVGLVISLAAWILMSHSNSRVYKKLAVLKRHQFLFEELVKRDFKKKYKRTVLGMAWSVLSPLLTLLVMRLVFTQFFGRHTPHYTTYLFCGNLVFSYFNESTGQGMTSLMGNAGIFSKVNVPKYLFLFSKNIQTLINFGLTLCVFFVFCILDNITFTWKFICLLYPICMLVLFNIGVGLILSALFVFFRDIQYLWSVFTQLLMYMSAIFYTIDNYSPMVRNLFLLNPVYLFIRYFRKIVIEATIPSIWFHLLMLADVVIVLAVGCWVYKKYNHKFLYYV